jgi:transcriptional regulator with XRE-family HTH domain
MSFFADLRKGAEVFAKLGPTLTLIRELRGKSQARVAREAKIGKSQLSKYENGKELPKLESLEKVLSALGIGYFDFFYTLELIDRRAEVLTQKDGRSALPLDFRTALFSNEVNEAFNTLMADVLSLYGAVLSESVIEDLTRNRKE